MDWTIVTPDGAAVWDQRELRFEDSPPRDSLPRSDVHEDLWRTYYRSICNVARLKPAAMKREMPMHRWKNLPETAEIPALMREAPRNVARFDEPATRARHAPIRSAGPAIKDEDAAARRTSDSSTAADAVHCGKTPRRRWPVKARRTRDSCWSASSPATKKT